MSWSLVGSELPSRLWSSQRLLLIMNLSGGSKTVSMGRRWSHKLCTNDDRPCGPRGSQLRPHQSTLISTAHQTSIAVVSVRLCKLGQVLWHPLLLHSCGLGPALLYTQQELCQLLQEYCGGGVASPGGNRTDWEPVQS